VDDQCLYRPLTFCDMLPRFYHSELIEQPLITLGGDEAKHIIKVLRMRKGDELELCNGEGLVLRTAIQSFTKQSLDLDLLARVSVWDHRPELHVAIAPTKNIDRFEWFLEKATEIGIGRVSPILCDHSERKRFRHDRAQRILVAAMKQSGRSFLPLLDEMRPFDEVLAEVEGAIYIAHCGDGEKHDAFAERDVTVFIGPEGDFSPQEISSALARQARELSLGDARLRTETAGLMATMLYNRPT
jgi:16S rRNA (uracil1498-N3)-methyltransferase